MRVKLDVKTKGRRFRGKRRLQARRAVERARAKLSNLPTPWR